MTSAPPTAALTVVAPAICRKLISPAIKAFIPSTPLGVAMTSTSNPCFLKIPASRASQGTAIDPDNEVMATRSLRTGAASPAPYARGTTQYKAKPHIKPISSKRICFISPFRL
jgi:hypothetical protein